MRVGNRFGSTITRAMGLMLVLGWGGVVFAQSPAPLNSAKVVYVGHSLINHDVPEMVKSISESLTGLSYRRAVQIINGGSIQANWERCRESTFTGQWPPLEFACDAIEAGTDLGAYDALVVTQVNNPLLDANNDAVLNPYHETPRVFEQFLNLFLSRNANGRAFFYAPWEEIGSQWHKGQEWTTRVPIELAAIESAVMQIEEISRVQRGREVDVNIIPTNLALRNLVLAAESGNFNGITNRSQLFSDGVHMTPLGNYFMACLVFSSVYQRSPVGASGRTTGRYYNVLTDIPADLANRLQAFAWQQTVSYRGWSAQVVRPRAPGSLTVN